MLHMRVGVWMCVVLLGVVGAASAQQSPALSGNSTAVVPRVVSFNGTVTDLNGKPVTRIVGVTFALYRESQGGPALWIETQSVQPDKSGRYSVMLGSTTTHGLPADIFAAGEARWLGVQIEAQAEQPRVLLASVPYALKAADAQTVGGLPASAFVLAAPPASTVTHEAAAGTAAVTPNAAGTGTQNYVPLWTDSAGTLGNSVLYQSGSGTAAKIGVGTTTPSVTLDVKGGSTVRGLLALPTKGTATATAAYTSQPLKFTASVFNSGAGTATAQNFQWQAEPLANNTTTASGSLNLLYSTGANALAETGLKIANNGQITFAAGQAFPGTGTGNGTVTRVATGLGLTGGPITSSGTLAIDPGVVPQLAAANVFTGNQTVNGNLSATGLVTGTAFSLGSNLFAFGNYGTENVYLGFAGNPASTGYFNTGIGFAALQTSNSSGGNTATGFEALSANTTGSANTANGMIALSLNTTGSNNTATGAGALWNNTTGEANTAHGGNALAYNTTGVANTAMGQGALYYSTGNNNSALGAGALYNNTAGGANTAAGLQALSGNTTGNDNTAIGEQSLNANTTGGMNTAGGYGALFNNATGSYNTALGYSAGPDANSTNLTNATAIGANAVVSQSNALVLGGTGANAVNVGIGTPTPAYTLDVQGSGRFTQPIIFAASQTFPGAGTITRVTAGTALKGGGSSGNVTLNVDTTKVVTGVTAGTDLVGGGTGGVVTLNLDTTKVPQLAAANTFTGSQTVNGNLSATGLVTGSAFNIGSYLFASGSYGMQNAFLGFAGNTAVTGSSNTAAGYGALAADTSGYDNTAVGTSALGLNTTGYWNTANGYQSLYANTSGYSNVSSGYLSLNTNSTGSGNAAVGAFSMQSNASGNLNASFGYYALNANTTGGANTATGADALASNQTGNFNTGTGFAALIRTTSASYNTATGYDSQYYSTTGANNTSTGAQSLYNNATGSYNTATGYDALFSNNSGSYNTALGSMADVASAALTNATAIGARSYVAQSNSLVLGGINGVNGASANTTVGIGTTTPNTGYLLDVEGNVYVKNLTKGGGSFKIDHPLDPANKYLYHSFVESPDMMNIYNGNVVTDKRGLATIELPDWFEALNRDFRYQLTVIGQFAQAIVLRKIQDNRFTIKTNKRGVEVSWQVTGIRQDAYANAYRIPLEEIKPAQEQGHYLHPELFGGPGKAASAQAHQGSRERTQTGAITR